MKKFLAAVALLFTTQFASADYGGCDFFLGCTTYPTPPITTVPSFPPIYLPSDPFIATNEQIERRDEFHEDMNVAGYTDYPDGIYVMDLWGIQDEYQGGCEIEAPNADVFHIVAPSSNRGYCVLADDIHQAPTTIGTQGDAILVFEGMVFGIPGGYIYNRNASNENIEQAQVLAQFECTSVDDSNRAAYESMVIAIHAALNVQDMGPALEEATSDQLKNRQDAQGQQNWDKGRDWALARRADGSLAGMDPQVIADAIGDMMRNGELDTGLNYSPLCEQLPGTQEWDAPEVPDIPDFDFNFNF